MPYSKLILEEGEVICSKCEGKGQFFIVVRDDEYKYHTECNKCNGEGKLDWITNIMWVDPEERWSFSMSGKSYSISSSSSPKNNHARINYARATA